MNFRVFSIVFVLSIVPCIAFAANTSITFGVDRTVSPSQVCVYDTTNTCQPWMTLPASGGPPLVTTNISGLTGFGSGVSSALAIAPNVTGGFLKQPTIAPGVYVNGNSSSVAISSVYNVVAYGAVGDGVTDNTSAIRAAFYYATASNQGEVQFPCGIFKVTGRINATITSNSNLSVRGSGSNCTFLYTSGTVGGILATYGNQNSSFSIKGMTLETDQTGTQTGIFLSSTAGNTNEYAPINTIDDVEFRGYDFTSTANNYWGTAFKSIGVTNINFIGGVCNMGVTSSPRGTCYYLDGAGTGTQPIAVLFNFTDVGINLCNIGIYYGNWIEGVALDAVNITGCNSGILTGTGASTHHGNELAIVNSQLNTYTCSICINDTKFIDLMVTNNYFLVEGNDIAMQIQGNFWNVSNNVIASVAYPTTTLGIVVNTGSGTNPGGVIQGNYFANLKTNLYFPDTTNAYHVSVTNNTSWDVPNYTVDYGVPGGVVGVVINDLQPRTWANLSGYGTLPCSGSLTGSEMLLSDWNGGAWYSTVSSGGGTGLTKIICNGSVWSAH